MAAGGERVNVASRPSKQAEREYLKRAGTESWERSKPFPLPGHDTIGDSPRHRRIPQPCTHREIRQDDVLVPWYGLDADRRRRWERLAARRRAWRAIQRIWRAALEGLGAGKRGPAFEDALGMKFVRIGGAATLDHPIVLARAGGMDS
jgi:hypothetical protein